MRLKHGKILVSDNQPTVSIYAQQLQELQVFYLVNKFKTLPSQH